jgi:hypothetical protein
VRRAADTLAARCFAKARSASVSVLAVALVPASALKAYFPAPESMTIRVNKYSRGAMLFSSAYSSSV